MEILSGEQMRQVDRHAIEELGIPGLQLMETAGRRVAEAVLQDWPEIRSRGLLVVCGKGNNGGDGLVAARHLRAHGVDARVLLLARAEDLRGDAESNLRAALGCGVPVEFVPDEDAWNRARTQMCAGDFVLDAMLGTGVRGGARGLVARVIEDLGDRQLRIAAIDLPSGLDGDSISVAGSAIRAERTYTLCRPKLPLAVGPAADFAGEWRVLPIGIPDESVLTAGSVWTWLDAPAVEAWLPHRARASHKGSYGHLLAVAGARGKSGAAVLLGRGALRCGVGLLTVATAASVRSEVATQQAEIMTEPLAETESGAIDADATDVVLRLLATRDALALGPGLGTAAGTRRAVLRVLERVEKPVVIDADGLNNLAAEARYALERLQASRGPRVLTPHPGEAARLLDTSTEAIQADRPAAAVELARRSAAVVVLKGAGTIVASPEERIAVNSTGNPGMATGGTGDVLTGMIGAYLARGLEPWPAACLGVYLHGLAGDLAAQRVGQESLLAGDVVDSLPAALAALRAGTDAAGRRPAP